MKTKNIKTKADLKYKFITKAKIKINEKIKCCSKGKTNKSFKSAQHNYNKK